MTPALSAATYVTRPLVKPIHVSRAPSTWHHPHHARQTSALPVGRRCRRPPLTRQEIRSARDLDSLAGNPKRESELPATIRTARSR